MIVEDLSIPGAKLIKPRVFGDERGFFTETWQGKRYAEHGLPEFVQDNHSRSVQGTLRGLHFTVKRPQSQLVYVSTGEIYDVIVDLRRASPAFGKWCAVRLSAENHWQVFMPAGIAHGFKVLSASADVHYKVSEFYDPHDEGGLNWADPDIAIDWPGQDHIISERDAKFPVLADFKAQDFPHVSSER